MATKTITIPDFDFSNFYYPEILTALNQYQRINVPEITDEADEEPFQQLNRCYSLVGHLNNVLLDTVATESLLPTARLLESVRGHLALIGYTLNQATPAVTDLIIEFSKVFNVATNVLPDRSRFGTQETSENPQIIYENLESVTIQRTDRATAMFAFNAGKIKILDNTFDGGDKVTVLGVDFAPGIDFSVGGSIAATLLNLKTAINSSGNPELLGIIYAISDGVDTLSLIPIDNLIENITTIEVDAGTDNFEVENGSFGSNQSGAAATPALPFLLFTNTPKIGDAFYIAHGDVMWDGIEFLFNTFGSGVTGVWEFFDGSSDDQKPTSVTNLGAQLELDLTSLLGSSNRAGSVVKVVLNSSGASEIIVSTWNGSKNIGTTTGLLGQVSVSTSIQDYIIGTFWNEVNNLTDETQGFTQDGVINYELPQNISQNWIATTINAVSGYWLRFRVISVSSPVNPEPDTINIAADKQYLKSEIVQGQTVAEAPLGSSNGAQDQEFILTFRPLIVGSLLVEVDEGSGFTPYTKVENFLNSTSQSRNFVLEISGDDVATITFGDGIRGKIPPSGVDNIRVIYRIGANSNGNVGANTIVVNKSGVPFVNRVFNPRQAAGYTIKEGSTEEDLARLKIEGPASIRTLGRAITPEDIEFLATQYTDSNGSKIVERAFAFEETFGVKTVQLVVVGQGGGVLTEAQKSSLDDYFNGNKSENIDGVLVANHEVTSTNYTPNVIDVTVVVTGGNVATITNAIKALLNPTAKFSDGVTYRWEPEGEVPVSLISSVIFEVDPTNIKKVVISSPAGDTVLGERELPLAGTITVTVV